MLNLRKELLELVLKNAFNFDGKYVGDGRNLKLIEDLEYDSLDLINLVVEIEEKFQMHFDETDVLFDKLNGFEELYALVENILRGQ